MEAWVLSSISGLPCAAWVAQLNVKQQMAETAYTLINPTNTSNNYEQTQSYFSFINRFGNYTMIYLFKWLLHVQDIVNCWRENTKDLNSSLK